MKLSKRQVIPIFLCFVLTGIMAMGASPNEKAEKEPVDKIVFVHYPKENPGKANGKPGGGSTIGGTGVLSNNNKYSGIHWKNQDATAIKYYVNTSGTYVTNAADAINASMDTWSNASTLLNFVYAGTNGANAGVADNLNIISWAPITNYPNAIAVTITWYYRYNKTIAEVDTRMNTAYAWSYTPPSYPAGYVVDLSGQATSTASRYQDPINSGNSSTYDIQNIMTHEAGHWLMLGDLYNSTDGELTMYGYGSLGELKKDTLGYGDELGVEYIYGS